MKKNKWILPSIMILLLIIATVGVTFTAFTFSKEGTVENTLETSMIMLTYTEGKTGITLNETYPMSDETGKILTGTNNVFDFTVTATLGKSSLIGYEVTAVKIPITDMTPLLDNEVKLYLERAIDPDTTYESIMEPTNFIPRETQTEIGSPVGSMILDQGNFTQEGTTIHHYRLRMWVDENTEITDMQKKYGIKINVYAKQDVAVVKGPNPNILNVYVYNQEAGSSNFCVTGEEATCVELEIPPKTYEAGTIIKYKVNDTEEKYFHVMFDEGDTLTLQQRENTNDSVAWYADAAKNTSGPLTALSILEENTKKWTNVLEQTYTLGITTFKDNAFTGCSYNFIEKKYNCSVNTYTLDKRTAKARMITVQEAQALGCTTNQKSCPIWMYNYLFESVKYGGTINKTENFIYWTSSAISGDSYLAIMISHSGDVYDSNNNSVSDTGAGIRAVINISKYA